MFYAYPKILAKPSLLFRWFWYAELEQTPATIQPMFQERYVKGTLQPYSISFYSIGSGSGS